MKFNQLLKEVNRVCALTNTQQSELYFSEVEKIKKVIDTYIRDADLSKLKGKEVLALCYWVYKFNVMPLHSWGIRCEKAIKQ